jgi:hypothetical protein
MRMRGANLAGHNALRIENERETFVRAVLESWVVQPSTSVALRSVGYVTCWPAFISGGRYSDIHARRNAFDGMSLSEPAPT